MTINYYSLAKEATKRGLWMKAPGGNRYAILSSLDPPHEGVLVDVGSERYTIIDEDDLVLLSLNKYRFDGRYVSSSNSTLHRDIMERRVEVDWTIRSLLVIHRHGDQFDNRRSNLRWIDRAFELDYRTMLPRDIKKIGRKYRVRISIDGKTRFRTYKNKNDAMDWWLDTRLKMMYDAWPRCMNASIIMRLNGMSDE